MQHLDEGTIHAWLDGALGPDEAARVEAHVAECPQCAAAVAEARGFIAASSRILTALDHVPRGVVPVARPARWSNPAVWRAAAAVLVVAAGTLVVARNSGNKAAPSFSTVQSADTASVRQLASPTAIMESSPQTTVTSSLEPKTGATEKMARRRAATDGSAATEQKLATIPSRVSAPENARARAPLPNIPTRENNAVAGQAGGVVSDRVPPSSGYASVEPAPPRIVIRGSMTALSARDSLSALGPLKVVGRPRQIGAKVTLYEVTPNDTVTLTELMNVQLESVVVTGMSTTRERVGAQAARKAAAGAPPQRADAAVTSPQDSEREAAGAAQARAPSAPAPVTAFGPANGITTITWTDAATGNVLKLSGRLPLAQLQQIKIRIERERAAAAAAAKKNP